MPNSDITTDSRPAAPGRAALALLLLLPAPTVGVLCAMYLFPDTLLGKGIYYVAKAWLLALPIVWLIFIDRGRLAIPKLHRRGMAAGLVTGLLTLGTIVGAWELFAHRMVDIEFFRGQMQDIGLGTPLNFLVFACLITFINALLEEYVWRWFVYTKWFEALKGPAKAVKRSGAIGLPGAGAIVLAGLFFVLHHAIAMNLYFDWQVVALASLGILIGHVTWSIIYLKYKNIYAAYLSHIFADIGVFVVGYQIAFG
jgi:hypothetical protein